MPLSFAGTTSVMAVLVCSTFLGHAGQIDWPVPRFTEVASGLQSPTHVTHAGDGGNRLFICEQGGRIRILVGTNLLPVPFLNITSKVVSVLEQGLLSIAFPPGFTNKNYFYVNYTRKPDGASIVSRFHISAADPNVADPSSEEVILINPQPGTTHNGGQLAFGPDGYLYISRGDGRDSVNPMNAQLPGNLLGKILRIDVESTNQGYRIPSSNPFVNTPGYRPEIWAMGLRNPWRFSFDRLTGDLFVGDVGEDVWEEISYQPANSPGGANYGWPYREGKHIWNYTPAGIDRTLFVEPVAEHRHFKDDGFSYVTSITGGCVYRGPDSPRLNGIYFYGNFPGRYLFGMKHDGETWQIEELFDNHPFLLSSFGEDEAGRLYLVDYRGRILRMEDSMVAPAPRFVPPGPAAHDEHVQVVTRSLHGVTRYTTDGREPAETDPEVPLSGLILITNGMTLKARTFRADLLPSTTRSMTYGLQAAEPVFSPEWDAITNETLITIASATPDATIHYSVNGSAWSVFSGPVTILPGTTITAVARRVGFGDSPQALARYPLMTAATPHFDPPSGALTSPTPITITTVTPGATIRYATTGSDVTITSPVYTNPVPVGFGIPFLRARAYRDGLAPSLMRSVSYKLVPPLSAQTQVLAGNPARLVMRWFSFSGFWYVVQRSKDLAFWEDTTVLPGSNATISVTNIVSATTNPEFFRISIRAQ